MEMLQCEIRRLPGLGCSLGSLCMFYTDNDLAIYLLPFFQNKPVVSTRKGYKKKDK